MASTTCFKTIIWNRDISKGAAQGITKRIDFFLPGNAYYNRDNRNSRWDQVLSYYEIEDSYFDTCDTTLMSSSEGVADCMLLSSEGDSTYLYAASYTSEDYEQDIRYPLGSPHGFTSSFADSDLEKLNTQILFDMDLVFFVCDNLTTGHICNDIRKFIPGTLRQTNKSLTTANRTGLCLQEGTVRLHLNDNDGVKHIFVLDNCLYHPNSLVNMLSTQRLAKKFIDDHGNPDEQTRIESQYCTHVLTCDVVILELQ